MLKCFLLAALLVITSARWRGGDAFLWREYKATFNVTWSATEDKAKYQCFVENLDAIEALNGAEADRATYALNQYAHMCHNEFHKLYNGLAIPVNHTRKFESEALLGDLQAASEQSVDWRKKGAVTPVKNQGECGSCWAFSAVGNMEGLNAIKTGELIEFSEEELVQCSGDEGNNGCSGGNMDKAFDWVAKNGGIDTEQDYPYTISKKGWTGKCKNARKSHVIAKFSGHIDIPADEDAMAAWVLKYGPISVGVYSQDWQLYKGGIRTACSAGQLNHGVLIVGYGTQNHVPYWIIKNSWGPMWGEGGYMRLKRGGNCNGVAESASSAKF